MKNKIKYSLASKERWAKKTPEERSEAMRRVVAKRWEKVSVEDRKKWGRKLVEARLKYKGF